MKTKTILYNLIIILLFSGFIYSQDDVSVINDDEYKFTIAFPAGWKKLETKVIPEKGVINYSLQKNNNDNGLMILAFKLTEVKDIDDFIYVLEKDASLNLPQRSSEFKDIEYDDYDGKSALYKDTN
ncbi:MAG: hypothetical protein FJ216_10175, partial [Ignavibacteria bacterium]|nr:hypothetical protein [Ignavibacteria bacterium]